MIAEQFQPLDIECLVKTAVELWEDADVTDLSQRQQEVLGRARDAVYAEYADQPPAAAVTTLIEPRPAMQVWILRRWDRHDDEVTLWADEGSALAALAEHVRGNWANVTDRDGVPEQAPADDREAVRLYYGPQSKRGDNDYTLYAEDVGRPVGRTRIVPLTYQFPDKQDCEQANRTAVFHPKTSPGDDTLPCLQTAGVLVFSYLDHQAEAVRVSIHLDTADDRLVRPDGTVPLRVVVEDHVIFDDAGQPDPRGERGTAEETDECEECGAPINANTPSMFSAEHAKSCSLHPANTCPSRAGAPDKRVSPIRPSRHQRCGPTQQERLDEHGGATVEFIRLGFHEAESFCFEARLTSDWGTFAAAVSAIGGYNDFAPETVTHQLRPLWDRLAYVTIGRHDGSPFIGTHLPVIAQQENGHQIGDANRPIPIEERRDLAAQIVTAAKRAKADAIRCHQATHTKVETGGKVGQDPSRVWMWWD